MNHPRRQPVSLTLVTLLTLTLVLFGGFGHVLFTSAQDLEPTATTESSADPVQSVDPPAATETPELPPSDAPAEIPTDETQLSVDDPVVVPPTEIVMPTDVVPTEIVLPTEIPPTEVAILTETATAVPTSGSSVSAALDGVAEPNVTASATATTTPQRMWTIDLTVRTEDGEPIPAGAQICVYDSVDVGAYSSCQDISSGTAHYDQIPAAGGYAYYATGIGHYHIIPGYYFFVGPRQPGNVTIGLFYDPTVGNAVFNVTGLGDASASICIIDGDWCLGVVDGTVEFEYVPEGTWDYTVSVYPQEDLDTAEGGAISGTFTVVAGETVSVPVNLGTDPTVMPSVTPTSNAIITPTVTTTVSMTPTTAATSTATTTGTVIFEVTDANTEMLYSSIEVCLEQVCVDLGGGTATFSEVTPGDYLFYNATATLLTGGTRVIYGNVDVAAGDSVTVPLSFNPNPEQGDTGGVSFTLAGSGYPPISICIHQTGNLQQCSEFTSGHASFAPIPIGEWTYFAQGTGFEEFGSFSVNRDETTPISVDYIAGGSVRFMVTGSGFTDASVCVMDFGCADVVDGQAIVADIPAGNQSYFVRATPIGTGIYDARGEVIVVSGTTVTVNIELVGQPAGNLIFLIPGSPSDLQVCIYGDDSFCDTVIGEQVAFENIAEGTWHYWATSDATGFGVDGYTEIADGETTTVTIDYVEPGSVTFQLNGTGYTWAEVCLDNDYVGCENVVDGHASFKSVPAGTWGYSVGATPGFATRGTVTVVPGEATTVTIDYVEPGSVTFILNGYDGDQAYASISGVGLSSGVWLVDGHASFDKIPANTYHYTVDAPGFFAYGAVEVSSGETTTVTIDYVVLGSVTPTVNPTIVPNSPTVTPGESAESVPGLPSATLTSVKAPVNGLPNTGGGGMSRRTHEEQLLLAGFALAILAAGVGHSKRRGVRRS